MSGNALLRDPIRYEVLPFPRAEREAAQTDGPLSLTVTCSPRHGIDASLDVAERLRAMGHRIILHLAARMVRGEGHLGEILRRLRGMDADDVFLVGGDAPEALGPYPSGVALIEALRAHALAPRVIGVPAYPEGHPTIDDDVLARALASKARYADYMTTQVCFEPDVLLGWIARTRAAGIDLPVYAGVPGAVERRRLLEVSLRVGVGASVRALRRQRGVRRLATGAASAPLIQAIDPLIGGDLGIAGYHVFTFNDLVGSVREMPPAPGAGLSTRSSTSAGDAVGRAASAR
ncbi:MAG: methylenetetrahydrofolate reductase [Solirubrobacteraceae bacterium]